MPAYVIYQAAIHDPAGYDAYRAEAGPNVAAAGGRYLVRGGATTPLEGILPPERTVVIEFADRATAVAWFESESYAAIRTLRSSAADVAAYVVDGTPP